MFNNRKKYIRRDRNSINNYILNSWKDYFCSIDNYRLKIRYNMVRSSYKLLEDLSSSQLNTTYSYGFFLQNSKSCLSLPITQALSNFSNEPAWINLFKFNESKKLTYNLNFRRYGDYTAPFFSVEGFFNTNIWFNKYDINHYKGISKYRWSRTKPFRPFKTALYSFHINKYNLFYSYLKYKSYWLGYLRKVDRLKSRQSKLKYRGGLLYKDNYTNSVKYDTRLSLSTYCKSPGIISFRYSRLSVPIIYNELILNPNKEFMCNTSYYLNNNLIKFRNYKGFNKVLEDIVGLYKYSRYPVHTLNFFDKLSYEYIRSLPRKSLLLLLSLKDFCMSIFRKYNLCVVSYSQTDYWDYSTIVPWSSKFIPNSIPNAFSIGSIYFYTWCRFMKSSGRRLSVYKEFNMYKFFIMRELFKYFKLNNKPGENFIKYKFIRLLANIRKFYYIVPLSDLNNDHVVFSTNTILYISKSFFNNVPKKFNERYIRYFAKANKYNIKIPGGIGIKLFKHYLNQNGWGDLDRWIKVVDDYTLVKDLSVRLSSKQFKINSLIYRRYYSLLYSIRKRMGKFLKVLYTILPSGYACCEDELEAIHRLLVSEYPKYASGFNDLIVRYGRIKFKLFSSGLYKSLRPFYLSINFNFCNINLKRDITKSYLKRFRSIHKGNRVAKALKRKLYNKHSSEYRNSVKKISKDKKSTKDLDTEDLDIDLSVDEPDSRILKYKMKFFKYSKSFDKYKVLNNQLYNKTHLNNRGKYFITRKDLKKPLHGMVKLKNFLKYSQKFKYNFRYNKFLGFKKFRRGCIKKRNLLANAYYRDYKLTDFYKKPYYQTFINECIKYRHNYINDKCIENLNSSNYKTHFFNGFSGSSYNHIKSSMGLFYRFGYIKFRSLFKHSLKLNRNSIRFRKIFNTFTYINMYVDFILFMYYNRFDMSNDIYIKTSFIRFIWFSYKGHNSNILYKYKNFKLSILDFNDYKDSMHNLECSVLKDFTRIFLGKFDSSLQKFINYRVNIFYSNMFSVYNCFRIFKSLVKAGFYSKVNIPRGYGVYGGSKVFKLNNKGLTFLNSFILVLINSYIVIKPISSLGSFKYKDLHQFYHFLRSVRYLNFKMLRRFLYSSKVYKDSRMVKSCYSKSLFYGRPFVRGSRLVRFSGNRRRFSTYINNQSFGVCLNYHLKYLRSLDNKLIKYESVGIKYITAKSFYTNKYIMLLEYLIFYKKSRGIFSFRFWRCGYIITYIRYMYFYNLSIYIDKFLKYRLNRASVVNKFVDSKLIKRQGGFYNFINNRVGKKTFNNLINNLRSKNISSFEDFTLDSFRDLKFSKNRDDFKDCNFSSGIEDSVDRLIYKDSRRFRIKYSSNYKRFLNSRLKYLLNFYTNKSLINFRNSNKVNLPRDAISFYVSRHNLNKVGKGRYRGFIPIKLRNKYLRSLNPDINYKNRYILGSRGLVLKDKLKLKSNFRKSRRFYNSKIKINLKKKKKKKKKKRKFKQLTKFNKRSSSISKKFNIHYKDLLTSGKKEWQLNSIFGNKVFFSSFMYLKPNIHYYHDSRGLKFRYNKIHLWSRLLKRLAIGFDPIHRDHNSYLSVYNSYRFKRSMGLIGKPFRNKRNRRFLCSSLDKKYFSSNTNNSKIKHNFKFNKNNNKFKKNKKVNKRNKNTWWFNKNNNKFNNNKGVGKDNKNNTKFSSNKKVNKKAELMASKLYGINDYYKTFYKPNSKFYKSRTFGKPEVLTFNNMAGIGKKFFRELQRIARIQGRHRGYLFSYDSSYIRYLLGVLSFNFEHYKFYHSPNKYIWYRHITNTIGLKHRLFKGFHNNEKKASMYLRWFCGISRGDVKKAKVFISKWNGSDYLNYLGDDYNFSERVPYSSYKKMKKNLDSVNTVLKCSNNFYFGHNKVELSFHELYNNIKYKTGVDDSRYVEYDSGVDVSCDVSLKSCSTFFLYKSLFNDFKYLTPESSLPFDMYVNRRGFNVGTNLIRLYLNKVGVNTKNIKPDYLECNYKYSCRRYFKNQKALNHYSNTLYRRGSILSLEFFIKSKGFNDITDEVFLKQSFMWYIQYNRCIDQTIYKKFINRFKSTSKFRSSYLKGVDSIFKYNRLNLYKIRDDSRKGITKYKDLLTNSIIGICSLENRLNFYKSYNRSKNIKSLNKLNFIKVGRRFYSCGIKNNLIVNLTKPKFMFRNKHTKRPLPKLYRSIEDMTVAEFNKIPKGTEKNPSIFDQYKILEYKSRKIFEARLKYVTEFRKLRSGKYFGNSLDKVWVEDLLYSHLNINKFFNFKKLPKKFYKTRFNSRFQNFVDSNSINYSFKSNKTIGSNWVRTSLYRFNSVDCIPNKYLNVLIKLFKGTKKPFNNFSSMYYKFLYRNIVRVNKKQEVLNFSRNMLLLRRVLNESVNNSTGCWITNKIPIKLDYSFDLSNSLINTMMYKHSLRDSIKSSYYYFIHGKDVAISSIYALFYEFRKFIVLKRRFGYINFINWGLLSLEDKLILIFYRFYESYLFSYILSYKKALKVFNNRYGYLLCKYRLWDYSFFEVKFLYRRLLFNMLKSSKGAVDIYSICNRVNKTHFIKQFISNRSRLYDSHYGNLYNKSISLFTNSLDVHWYNIKYSVVNNLGVGLYCNTGVNFGGYYLVWSGSNLTYFRYFNGSIRNAFINKFFCSNVRKLLYIFNFNFGMYMYNYLYCFLKLFNLNVFKTFSFIVKFKFFEKMLTKEFFNKLKSDWYRVKYIDGCPYINIVRCWNLTAFNNLLYGRLDSDKLRCLYLYNKSSYRWFYKKLPHNVYKYDVINSSSNIRYLGFKSHQYFYLVKYIRFISIFFDSRTRLNRSKVKLINKYLYYGYSEDVCNAFKSRCYYLLD